MVKSNQRVKKYTKRRRQSGGDSAAYTFGPAVAPGAPYASSVIPTSACMATPRPGELVGYSAGSGGLPGFAGGGRRGRGGRRRRGGRSRKQQQGGGYGTDVAAVTGGANPFAPIYRTGCEGGSINTLPPSIQATQRGGRRRKQSGGVGGIDSAFYRAQTAGYGNQASTWVSSSGSPSLLQTPYDARAMNPACLTTGGGRRRSGSRRRSRSTKRAKRAKRKGTKRARRTRRRCS